MEFFCLRFLNEIITHHRKFDISQKLQYALGILLFRKTKVLKFLITYSML